MTSSRSADADPSGPVAHADSLVAELSRLQALEARTFLAEARTLVDLESVADALDPVFGSGVWAGEAAMATGRSEGSVRVRTVQAHRLLALPTLCAALAGGALSRAHATALLEVLAPVPDELARRVCHEVVRPLLVDPLDRPAPSQLADRARRCWFSLDAEAVALQRRAALDARAVCLRPLLAPGVSALGGTGTAEAVLAAKARLENAAARPVDTEDLRTAAQREADLLLALLTHGTLPDADLPAAELQLVLHCPVETVAGRSDEPGLLVGVGLLDAEHCRELAARGAAVTVAEVDAETRMPTRLLTGQSDRLRPATGTEPGYVPSARLARLVRTRHPQGVAPMLSSWRHDLEHRVPWPRGGTSATNLVPLGRRWHRLKQAGFDYRPAVDGSVLWTSPRGRQVRVPQPWSAPRPRSPGTDPPQP